MSDRLPVKAAAASRLPSLNQHLEPERLMKRHGEAIVTMSTRCTQVEVLCYEIRKIPRRREEIRQDFLACPSPGALAAVADDIEAALALKPDRRATQAALAVMFDARVKGPQNPEVYLEALVYDLVDEGFPPAVVVGACQTLRRESTFTPEIAEVIAACRKKLTSYRAVASLAGRLLDTRERIDEALQIADAAPAHEPEPRPAPEPFDPNADPGDAGWD